MCVCVPEELGADTEDLYKCLVKSLNFDVDLGMGDCLEVGMAPGMRG